MDVIQHALTGLADDKPVMSSGGIARGAARRRMLTSAQAQEIRRRHAAGESQSALGRRYGISQPAIWQIIERVSYREV